MAELKHLSNNHNISNDVSYSLMHESKNVRDEFQIWLEQGNVQKYTTEEIICCMDKINNHAIQNKVTCKSIWEYIYPDAFSHTYNRWLAKLIHVTDRKTYKIFITAGKLYLCFLKERLSDVKKQIKSVTLPNAQEEISKLIYTSNNTINPEDVIAWLITQPNAKGTFYLEHVVRQYMSVLRTAPAKLDIPDIMNISNVFVCHTPEELNAYYEKYKAAPNYKQVNSSTSGMFSAGMNCLLRYLIHLKKDETNIGNEQKIINLIEQYGLKYIDKRNSGGALWVIGGNELCDVMTNLKNKGFPFQFKDGGGRTSNYRDAWWYKPSCVQEHLSIIKNNKLDSSIIYKITDVLLQHFSNGFRLNSPIELVRFRSFASKKLGEEMSLSDEELKKYILACGTFYDGKIYLVSNKTLSKIKGLIDDYFDIGAQVIFFTEFYNKNEKWFQSENIVSENMLIEILKKQYPNLKFTKTYFGYTNEPISTLLEKEILRVWDGDLLLTYNQISERLPYIPVDRIKYTLGQNSYFIWNSLETYTHISRIEIEDNEREEIKYIAMKECNSRGYISINNLPFISISERYYELSTTAIYNAIYQICLSDEFSKKGKIITRNSDAFDILSIIKEYCCSVDKCTISDILNYENELTGERDRWIAIDAANSILVRIDSNMYVADRYVNFNIELIDQVIDLVIREDYIPLKSFITFGAFPECGQTWNLFVLESYCRRFSKKFCYETLSTNSHNVGVVKRKNCTMNYTEIMADAVAKAGVPLNEKEIAYFLCDRGYICREKTAKASKIIKNIKALCERKD